MVDSGRRIASPAGAGAPRAGADALNSSPSTRDLMIVLAYLGPLAVVPWLADKDDAGVQWHAKHGLVLLAAEVLFMSSMTLVLAAASYVWFPLGCAVSFAVLVAWLVIFVVHVAAILAALNGRRLVVPGISRYADRF
jgi:hypothetical protein